MRCRRAQAAAARTKCQIPHTKYTCNTGQTRNKLLQKPKYQTYLYLTLLLEHAANARAANARSQNMSEEHTW